MASVEEMKKKYYTEEGLKALETRLKSLSELIVNKNTKYPLKARILGFIPLKIHSLEHHQGMIDELCQILGKNQVKVEVTQNDIA